MQAIRAQLDASSLRLSFCAEKTIGGVFAADGAAPESAAFVPGEVFERDARQRLRLQLEGVGAVEIGRGEEDRDLEELAREFEELRADFDDSLATYQVEGEGSEALDRLTERRYQRESWEQALAERREELEALAPEGEAFITINDRKFRTHRRYPSMGALEVWCHQAGLEIDRAFTDMKQHIIIARRAA